MKVVSYDSKYKQDFIDMNRAWITDMFVIEKEDIKELEGIEEYIRRGGQIFFTLDDNDYPIACCMVAPREDGEWEIMKFAARSNCSGKGAGSACLRASIDYAKDMKIDKLIIVSNRKCEQAVHLYKKFGFIEIPVDKKRFPFDRADIAFEMYI